MPTASQEDARRRTKIVATLGPATDDPAVLEQLIRAGTDVFRINFSHGTSKDQAARVATVRQIADKVGRHIGIMGDLQGPKIRIESFKNGPIMLVEDAPFLLDTAMDPNGGDDHGVGVAYRNLVNDVGPGDVVLLDDGLIVLAVEQVEGTRITCRVKQGGKLSDHKGLNKQGGGLSAPALTDKDRRDIETAARLGLDFMSVSFARNAEDIEEARALLRAAGGQAHIVAKIERAEAVQNIRSIIDASDVIMVARGDLAVEVGYASMTGLQKGLIRLARARNRVCITATQMLESMINSPSPTRAEVSDVANAVMDGTDAVMLSAETAVGKIPGARREHDGGAVCRRREARDVPARRELPARGRVRARRRGDRDGRDVRRESLERARDHRADRVGLDDAVDVARALRHSRVRVHAARGDAPPREHVPRRVRGAVRRDRRRSVYRRASIRDAAQRRRGEPR